MGNLQNPKEAQNASHKKSKKSCFLRGCVCAVLLFISLVLITGACLSMIPAAPADYTTKTKTGFKVRKCDSSMLCFLPFL